MRNIETIIKELKAVIKIAVEMCDKGIATADTSIGKINKAIDKIEVELSERQSTTKDGIDADSKALHIADDSKRIFTVVDSEGDLINCWKNESDAKEHAKELSDKNNSIFEVVSEPLF